MNTFNRILTIKESLNEIRRCLADDITLAKHPDCRGGSEPILTRVNRLLADYNLSLGELQLEPRNQQEQTELNRAKCSISLVESLVDILSQIGAKHHKQSNTLYQVSMALNQEALFSPKELYQLKEDFEALSLLHTKHKKETKYLLEQSAIATQRNAQLRVENDELKDELACLRACLRAEKCV